MTTTPTDHDNTDSLHSHLDGCDLALDDVQVTFLELLADGPISARDIAERDDIHLKSPTPIRRRMNEMREAGLVDRMRDPHGPQTYLYYRTDRSPLADLGFHEDITETFEEYR